MTEQFKGEVQDIPLKWPKELGAEHPFRFEDVEKVYKKYGLINGVINKIANNIVGEFTVECENENIQALIDDFIINTNFPVVVREWIKEGFAKGNGFMEIDLKEGKLRVINANNMYVKRNQKGDILEYNQYLGDLKRFNSNSRKLVNFTPNRIAHLKINQIADEPYALGIIWPNERVIENIIKNEQDKQKLIGRKAGAPIHVKFGVPGESVNTEDIDLMKQNLQYMTNRTEWVTDANCDMKVIDFGDIGKNLADALNYDLKQLIAGLDVPEVLLNSGQLIEGIAKTQSEGWQRNIRSYQDLIESVIIEKIINPYLEYQGLKGKVDFIRNMPGEEEKNARLEKLNMVLGNMALSENMKRIVQLEIAIILNIKDASLYLSSPEKGLDEQEFSDKKDMNLNKAGLEPTNNTPIDKEREKEKDIKQPEVPGAKSSAELNIVESLDFSVMGVREFINLKEIKGFNYSDYIVAILKRLKIDKFEDLWGITEADIEKGMLTEEEVKKLKTILKDGFRKNLSMRDIELNIRENIKLKDRIREDGGIIPAMNRPEMIARTEVVRIANLGLKDLFIENNVEKIQWLAALSDRTCDLCLGLDGQVIKITESFSSDGELIKLPPRHNNCRCSIISI